MTTRTLPPTTPETLPEPMGAGVAPTREEAEMDQIGRIYGTDRVGHVHVGGGAAMSVPIGNWPWQLRYMRPEPNRGPTICDDRMLAAGICESYLYLVQECTKEEAWRRIKIIRKAIKDHRAFVPQEGGKPPAPSTVVRGTEGK